MFEPDSESIVRNAYDVAPTTSQLRAEHKQETSLLQKAMDHLTAFAGWPGFVIVLVVAIILWILLNLFIEHFGMKPFDPPPFPWLEAVVSTGALFVAVLILTTQRREDQLAAHRLQLVLELSILNDRKIAKVIELIEEARRDSPTLANRVDGEANSMSMPSDTQAVLKAIKDVPPEVNIHIEE